MALLFCQISPVQHGKVHTGEGKLGGLDFDGHDGGLKRVGEVGRSAW